MQQGGGGSQYGVPPSDMTPFASPPAGTPRSPPHILGISGSDHLQQQQQQQQQQSQQQPRPLAEAASPISSRPPPPPRPSNFDELGPAVPGSFPDDDALAAAGEEADRGGVSGNRWPRQETLALLKIRSEMDAAFRDATLKGPLWEEVSRKLAELGYIRSAKKCKEKFENVHKYYKRTKEGRAGRQDGKNYRFFSQLEALHSSSSAAANPNISSSSNQPPFPALPAATPPPTSIGLGGMVGPSGRIQTSPPISAPPISSAAPARIVPDLAATAPAAVPPTAGISFSSTSSSSSSGTDDEDTEEGIPREGRKRKHGGGPGGSRKMMAFFEGLMKQVMERQEAMQQKFLETIEKREQDRMIREEAWKRHEMARLDREHELMAQERAMAASRDAAVIAFLQKISGQNIQLPPGTVIPAVIPPTQPSPAPAPAPAPQPQPPPHQSLQPQQPQLQQQQQHYQSQDVVRHQPSSSSTELVPVQEQHDALVAGGYEAVPSSRWPKAEVHALISLRSGLESRYQEAGPKGPLWEEISSEMQRLGYNRSAKRCKEKWENINKYFKKVKESNKKRPEDAKTCPYFHQLDALYRKKLLSSGVGGGSSSSLPATHGNQRPQETDTSRTPPPEDRPKVLTIMPPPPQAPIQPESEIKNGNGNRNSATNPDTGGGGSTSMQIPTSNGGVPSSFLEEGSSDASGTMMKKPEDIMKELMEQQHHHPPATAVDDYDKLEEPDSDTMDQDEDDDDDDDEEEDRKMQYKIQFQRPNVGGSGGSSSNASAKTAAAATAAGSFLAMVQ